MSFDFDEAEFGSEVVTRKIRVTVRSFFDASRSQPANGQWFFLYTIRIANEGDEVVQLLDRHWIITDETGKVEEVRGPGVVGEQPILGPDQGFEYTSGCPLPTSTGTMRGSYGMVNQEGEMFRIEVAEFVLSEPFLVN